MKQSVENGLVRIEGVGLIHRREMFSDNRISAATALLCVAKDDDRPDDLAQLRKGAGATVSERTQSMDIRLRLTGLALLCLAAATLYWLTHLVRGDGDHPGTDLEYLLALIAFVSASGGSILLTLGRHIFDQAEISDRWKPRD